MAGLSDLLGPGSTAEQFLLWGVGYRLAESLLRPVLSLIDQKVWSDAPVAPITPADLADMVERSIMSQSDAAAEAAKSGINGDRFAKLVLDTGEPPGIESMLRLWRRGDLDTATLERMIAYSRIRTEWTAQVEKLAHEVLPAADVVEGYIKGHIDHDTAQQMFAAAGGMAQEFDLAATIAGNPIGVTEAARLYNHGLINHDQLVAVIRASRINPAFEPMAELLHFQYLSAFQIERMLSQGTITADEATAWLTQDGYPPDQVAGLVAGAHTVKATKAKEAAESMITDAYEAGLITEAQAIEQLGASGYPPAVAQIILTAYDAKKILAINGQGVTQVRKAYLAANIDRAQASTDLDGLHIDPSVRDHYLALWDLERATPTKELTATQLGTLGKDGIVSWEYVVARLRGMGYSLIDAQLFTYLHGNPPPANLPVF